MAKRLSRSFYQRPCLEVAPELLGKGLRRRVGGQELLAQIVEVEAYLGKCDPASHAFRRTARSEIMFERGGACYVYLSYGMNYCMNVVTGKKGEGEAILFRAAEPLSDPAPFFENRKLPITGSLRNLLSGPGKLTQALGIDLRFNGTLFGANGIEIVDLGIAYAPRAIRRGPRIGISKAVEMPYRFTVAGSAFLSRRT